MTQEARSAATPLPEPVFWQHCRVCGYKIETLWGPDVHSESAYAMREHVLSHAQYELVDFAIKEALRGTAPH